MNATDAADAPSAHAAQDRLAPHASGGVSMVTLRAANQTLMLLPERVVFLPESDTLLVADAQLGADGLRYAPGEAAPQEATEAALTVLSRLCKRLDIKRIIFLGDFLHPDHALKPDTLAAAVRWRELNSAVECTLVRGVQRAHRSDPAPVLDIQAFEEPLMHRGLALTHYPRRMSGAYVLGGQLNPSVSVRAGGDEQDRLPCFVFSKHLGVLPAFGAVLGLVPIQPVRGERVFVAAADRVFELQARQPRR